MYKIYSLPSFGMTLSEQNAKRTDPSRTALLCALQKNLRKSFCRSLLRNGAKTVRVRAYAEMDADFLSDSEHPARKIGERKNGRSMKLPAAPGAFALFKDIAELVVRY